MRDEPKKPLDYIKSHTWILELLTALLALLLAAWLCLQLSQSHRQDEALAQLDARLDRLAETHDTAMDALAEDLTAQLEDFAASRAQEADALREELHAALEVPPLDLPLSAELQRHTLARCAQLGLDPADFLAIMYRESGFEADAVNHNRNGTTDVGLMQINSVNWPWLAELGVDVHTPAGSIDAAAVILWQFSRKGYTREQVLAAYALGEAGMLRSM